MAKNLPLVSIVIPTYGRVNMLEKAIESVLEQTYQNIEVIVVNDNKKESIHYSDTMIFLEKYRYTEKVIIIADGENCGGSGARNKGIKVSKGKYITFLDDDDYFYKDKIEKQLNFLLINDADIVLCDMDISLDNNIIKKSKKGTCRGNSINDFIVNGNIYTPMIFAKKYVLECVDGFTETPRFQDHILMLKLFERGFKVLELHQSLFVHLDHKENRITLNGNTKDAYDIRKKIELKNLKLLNKKEIKKYYINNFFIDLTYYKANRIESFKFIVSSFKYISSFRDLYIVINGTLFFLKNFIRV